MKKLILLAIFALSFASVKAQSFYYGPTLGLNVSTLTKQSYSKAYLRGSLGVQAGYNITNILALHAEAQYSWQGTKYNDSDTSLAFNYMKIPLMARLSIVKNLTAEAGVSFNFLVNSKIKGAETTQYDGDSAADINGSITDLCHKFDFSIPIGISYLFIDKLEVGLRYDLSMRRVWIDSSNKSKNSNLSIALRYRL